MRFCNEALTNYQLHFGHGFPFFILSQTPDITIFNDIRPNEVNASA